nr:MAG TPA: hypothetical protein [Caudoviricetes sp.]
MAKYITRTIVTYNTKVTFVMNGQIDTYKLNGEVGKKEAKKILISVFGNNDIIIVSCEKEEESSALYKMLEKDFIAKATKESTCYPI